MIEDLRYTETNRDDVKNFEQAAKGDVISDYLINKAWKEIKKGGVRSAYVDAGL